MGAGFLSGGQSFLFREPCVFLYGVGPLIWSGASEERGGASALQGKGFQHETWLLV